MPANIAIGVLSLLIALITYSIGTIAAFRRKGFTKRDVIMLWVGVVFDVVATVMMGMQIGGLDLRAGYPLFHTTLALIAWFGMTLGAILGTYALAKKDDRLASAAANFLLAPWILWVASFVEGMITRGSARMGG